MVLLLTWLISSFAFWLGGKILPGIKIKSFFDAIIVAAIFGIFDFFLGWFLFVLIGVATLGIGFLLFFVTRIFVAAIILGITNATTKRIEVRSFGWAMACAGIVSVFTFVLKAIPIF